MDLSLDTITSRLFNLGLDVESTQEIDDETNNTYAIVVSGETILELHSVWEEGGEEFLDSDDLLVVVRKPGIPASQANIYPESEGELVEMIQGIFDFGLDSVW